MSGEYTFEEAGVEVESNYKAHDVGVHNPADVVNDEEHAWAGGGIFDAGFTLAKSIKDANDVGIGLGVPGLALETIGLVLDPIGSLLAAGIGWIIEHITILRWPLDLLHGDPFGIKNAESALKQEKDRLAFVAEEHVRQLETLMQEWTGKAADEFKKKMDEVGRQVGLLGDFLETAGKQMKIAGALIGVYRGIIRDFIAMFLATVLKGALIAAALAPVTFGGSIAVFVATTIAGVGVLLGKTGAQMAKCGQSLTKLDGTLKDTSKAADDMTSAAASAAGKPGGKPGGAGGGGGSVNPKPPPKVDPPPKDTTTPPPKDTTPPPPKDTTPPPPPKDDTTAPSTNGGGAPTPPKDDTTTPSNSGGTPPPKVDPPPPAPTRPPPAPPKDPAPPSGGYKPESRLDPPKMPLNDKATAEIRQKLDKELSRKLGNNPAFPPHARNEVLRKFDLYSNFSVEQLSKMMPPAAAHRFESAVKIMTDPMFGKRGLTGKTIVDIIKGVPSSTNKGDNEE